ncbi:MAG: hypothetical protein N4A54_12045 [Peptostreptococcaceae bacterium]|jgi:hypothetical protein|nr:hypothetical protein [Peptostreptococcaceae bacterium]
MKNLCKIILIAVVFVLCSCNNKDTNKNNITSLELQDDDFRVLSNLDYSKESNSGVLIGLKSKSLDKDTFDYRTIYIYNINQKINYTLIDDVIIAPYIKGFWEIKNFDEKKSLLSKEVESNSSFSSFKDYDFKFLISKLSSFPLDSKYKDYDIDEDLESNHPYKNHIQELLHVGNNYVMIKDNYFQTDAKEYSSTKFQINLYPIYDLHNKKLDISEIVNFSLREISTVEDYENKYTKILESVKNKNNENIVISKLDTDLKNSILKRKNGHWNLFLPTKQITYNPKNESLHESVKDLHFITRKSLPWEIAAYDDNYHNFDEVKNIYGDTYDLISSPNNNMFLVFTKNQLLVFDNIDLNNPKLKLDLKTNEEVILNQWAMDKYVSIWNNIISKN